MLKWRRVNQRRIAATPLLALMIITGHHARAAGTAAVIILSCDGTVRTGPRPDDVQRVSERRVVVNFAEHTVSGFVTSTGSALIANIVREDDTTVDFSGGSTPEGTSSLIGTIDRVTGATTVHATTWARNKIPGGKTMRGLSYFLVCRSDGAAGITLPQ
jgi:hypothetical protein